MGEILSSIGQVIEMGLRAAFYSIGSFVYQAIIYMYNLFEKLCNGRFLDSELLESFSERIGLILGLLMLFIVIFSMIKMVLDPDKITDKEMGASSLIKKLVIVIVMLGTSGFVFDALYTVQKLVIENNVISKLLLPVQLDDKTSENFGAILSEELLFAFYHVNEFNGEPPADVSKCESVVNNLRNDIILYQDFALGKVCLNTTTKVNVDGEDTDMYIINYNWIFSVGVGCVVLYLLFMYCISIGTRMIQLMFLEIIAPMAIVSYVLPKKDTMFSKWTKMYIATYIDVFIRIAIINFIVFIISTLFVTDGAGFAIFWDSIGGKPTGAEHKFILVIIIIALLTFAKKAPDLLKELMPAGASSKLGFGMKSPKQLFDGMLGGNMVKAGAKAATVGAAIGAVGAFNSARSRYKVNMKDVDKSDPTKVADARKKALFGAAGGAFMAFGRGVSAGATSKGNVFKSASEAINKQKNIDDKYDNLITTGGDLKGRAKSKFTSYYGETQGQEYTRKIKNNQDFVDAYKKIDDLAESFLEVKKYKGLWQNAQARGESDEVVQMHFDNYKAIKQAMITSSIQDNPDYQYEVQLKTVWTDENGKQFIVDNDPRAVEKGEMNVKSLASASQIQVDFADIQNLVDTGRVKLSYKTKNSNGEIVTVTVDKENLAKLNNADALDKATAAAATAISEIKKTPGYSAAIANDKAAGVDSSATSNK